jgi:hypothetical protein
MNTRYCLTLILLATSGVPLLSQQEEVIPDSAKDAEVWALDDTDKVHPITGNLLSEGPFDAERGFLLNGRRVKLNGVCLHDDAGAVAAAVPERVWERRFEILKEMGCNAIRTSHNPMAPVFMDLCDRMGFLVMDEILDEWKVYGVEFLDHTPSLLQCVLQFPEHTCMPVLA